MHVLKRMHRICLKLCIEHAWNYACKGKCTGKLETRVSYICKTLYVLETTLITWSKLPFACYCARNHAFYMRKTVYIIIMHSSLHVFMHSNFYVVLIMQVYFSFARNSKFSCDSNCMFSCARNYTYHVLETTVSITIESSYLYSAKIETIHSITLKLMFPARPKKLTCDWNYWGFHISLQYHIQYTNAIQWTKRENSLVVLLKMYQN